MVDTFTNDKLENNSGNGSEKAQQARAKLRKHMRAARKALDEKTQAKAANALLSNVMAALAQHETTKPLHNVAGYLAFQGEIDVSPVMQALRAKSIATYVPMLDGDILRFAPWSEQTPHTTNRFGITEPLVPENQWIPADKLDAVLVPLVAFDNAGHRMGMGGGFYDKTFSQRRKLPGPPWLFGVAHELQRVESVYPEWWDVKLDNILTDVR